MKSLFNLKKRGAQLIALLLLLTCLFTACNVPAETPGDSESSTEQITNEPGNTESDPSDKPDDSEPQDSETNPSETIAPESGASGTDLPETGAPDTDAPVLESPALTMPTFDLQSVPDYTKLPYVAINGNVPFFTPNQYSTESYEYYSPLDNLGRCGITVACVGKDIMPTEDRGSISSVKPTGWHSTDYDIVDGGSLYNRCHLIAFQLTGENANRENLITGTRYLNVQGMIPFENMVADYVKETGNHVMYRVTPVFVGNELVARGVIIEGYSVEDNGDGITFCAYAYNVQPGIIIDYATGESRLDDTAADTEAGVQDYVLNKSSRKFHYPTCSSVNQMSDKNKEYFTGTRDELEKMNYSPCGSCRP